MKYISLLLLFLVTTILFLISSCGGRTNISRVVTVQNNKVLQKSEEIAKYRRIHFSFNLEKEEISFTGISEVNSYLVKDRKSVPKDRESQYYGAAFVDKDNETVYESINKLFYYQASPFHEKFYINKFDGDFYIDIPLSVDISRIKRVAFHLIGDNQDPFKIVEIENIQKAFINIVKSDDGWNGELKTFKIWGEHRAEEAFDIVILTEGFTASELSMTSKNELLNSKFGKGLKEYFLPLLDQLPFSLIKNRLNIWVVATPSKDSGADIPSENIYRSTVYDATFDTYCVNRKLSINNHERAIEFAAKVPFDQAIVFVNTKKHGGVGSDIATFSFDEMATQTIKHELGHAIALLGDEYNYISDKVAIEECKQSNIHQQSLNIDKWYGRNRISVKDVNLAPNITFNSDPKTTKWADLLTEDSPVVLFDKVVTPVEFIKNSNSIKGKFRLQADQYEFLIKFGLHTVINRLTTEINRIEINGVQRDYTLVYVGDYIFCKVDGELYSKEEEVTVELFFKKEYKDYVKAYFEYGRFQDSFFTLPSRTFKEGELGLFQGTSVDSSITFRPSYRSIMMLIDEREDFNLVQLRAYLEAMEYFAGIKFNIPRDRLKISN